MPLKKTPFGRECPLGKFKINPTQHRTTQSRKYTADPREICPKCNLSGNSREEFDLEEVCQSPPDITLSKYVSLKKEYEKTEGEHTKAGLQQFVMDNYQATIQSFP